MSHWAIWAAAGLSFAWFLVHTFVGGHQVAKPFRTDPVQDHRTMATLVMCWNMVTGVLFVLFVLFLLGALVDPAFVLAGTLLALAIAVGGLATRGQLGTTFKVIPQGWLFVPIVGLGLWGMIAA